MSAGRKGTMATDLVPKGQEQAEIVWAEELAIVRAWLEYVEETKRLDTYNTYFSSMSVFLRYVLPRGLAIRTIKKLDLERYKAWLHEK